MSEPTDYSTFTIAELQMAVGVAEKQQAIAHVVYVRMGRSAQAWGPYEAAIEAANTARAELRLKLLAESKT
jgi:hypothetical protein